MDFIFVNSALCPQGKTFFTNVRKGANILHTFHIYLRISCQSLKKSSEKRLQTTSMVINFICYRINSRKIRSKKKETRLLISSNHFIASTTQPIITSDYYIFQEIKPEEKFWWGRAIPNSVPAPPKKKRPC